MPVSAGVGNLEAVFTMNAVGAVIWNGIDGRATLGDLTRAVTAAFAVGPELAARDVADYVGVLAARGLVVAGEVTS